MAYNGEHGETRNVRDRLIMPILLPVVCLVITVALIVVIGEFLLLFGDEYMTIGGEHIFPQVFAALGLALVFLIGFAVLASRWAPDDKDTSH